MQSITGTSTALFLWPHWTSKGTHLCDRRQHTDVIFAWNYG